MRMKLIALATTLAAGITLSGTANANALGTAKAPQANVNSMVEQVDHHWRRRGYGYGYGAYWKHRGRCYAWRHECADRWGWGTRKFHRCLVRHGCAW